MALPYCNRSALRCRERKRKEVLSELPQHSIYWATGVTNGISHNNTTSESSLTMSSVQKSLHALL